MFFAGIITSALPYILLAGVFGTLLVSQVTDAGQKEPGEQASEESLHRQIYSKQPGNSDFLQGDTYEWAQRKKAPEGQKKNPPPGLTRQGQPLFAPGSRFMRFFLGDVPPFKPDNPIAHYTLRGPPLTA